MNHKNLFVIPIKNSFASDDSTGVVTFKPALTITDTSEQWNGTKYDISSMDLSEYNNQLTADHSDSIKEVIGETFGIKKGRGKVTIEGIRFAINESALALFAYNMVKSGFLKSFSIETMGPFPDEDGIYHDSKLVGLSLVVVGNNKSAKINQVQELAMNSVEQARSIGLDTEVVENLYLLHNQSSHDMKLTFIKNTRPFAVKVTYKNSAGEEVTSTVAPGEGVDVSEDQKDAVETQVREADEPQAPAPQPTPVPAQPEPAQQTTEETLNKILSPVMEKIEKMEKQMFNKVEEPQFTIPSQNRIVSVSNNLSKVDWKDRAVIQINAFLDGDEKKLTTVNQFHMEQLKQSGKVSNAVTLGDFGNFVISDEMLTEIQGFRSDYSPLVSAFPFQDTLSLTMAWLDRAGDINMQPVEMCDDGSDGNLKPISDYTATIKQATLEELAAVTPVCNAATRFLAADLLGDVAQGYRTDYQRKLSQLVIARLEQAVESNGNSAVYTTTSDINALKSWTLVMAELAESTQSGVLIMSYASYWELVRRLIGSGMSGNIQTVFENGTVAPVFGIRTILVPNDLLPTLNTAETKSFTVGGTNVTVNHAVFYVNPQNFKGRTSGGLSYDLSTEAAYEEGATLKSAFQRNELVVRGSFFRGGQVLDADEVSALRSAGVS